MEIDIIKVLVASSLTFFLGILMTPFWTNFLFKNKLWKKRSGKIATTGETAVIFNELHREKEIGTPRMGGVLIWLSVIVTGLFLWILSKWLDSSIFSKLDFISRNQTWVPFATLAIGAIVGLIDDLLEVRINSNGGLSSKIRLAIVFVIGLLIGTWFMLKLDISTINLPIIFQFDLGFIFVLFFALVMLVIYSGGVIDGLDGLSGGIFAIIFAAYGTIAFAQNQIDLAAFCGALVGGILAFLWFNIPPARFYMSETGTMALTIVLTIVAFMTDQLGEGRGVIVLPIIAFPLLAAFGSSFIQILSKKIFHRKVFLVAPIHHHFEALGWPAYKVVMRFWIIAILCATFGVILALM